MQVGQYFVLVFIFRNLNGIWHSGQLQEARALLGRLEYQRGNFDAALQVFYGIDIKTLSPRMTKAITERTRQQRKSRSKSDYVQPSVMSLHSVSLLLEAMLLKAKSLNELGKVIGMPMLLYHSC